MLPPQAQSSLINYPSKTPPWARLHKYCKPNMNQYLHKCDGYFHKYHKLPLDSPVCGTLQFKMCNLRFICKNIASQTWTNICTHVMDISINIINYPQTAQRLWQSAEHCNMQICILRLLCTNIASFDLKTHT